MCHRRHGGEVMRQCGICTRGILVQRVVSLVSWMHQPQIYYFTESPYNIFIDTSPYVHTCVKGQHGVGHCHSLNRCCLCCCCYCFLLHPQPPLLFLSRGRTLFAFAMPMTPPPPLRADFLTQQAKIRQCRHETALRSMNLRRESASFLQLCESPRKPILHLAQ